jgi:hypothetical protein
MNLDSLVSPLEGSLYKRPPVDRVMSQIASTHGHSSTCVTTLRMPDDLRRSREVEGGVASQRLGAGQQTMYLFLCGNANVDFTGQAHCCQAGRTGWSGCLVVPPSTPHDNHVTKTSQSRGKIPRA